MNDEYGRGKVRIQDTNKQGKSPSGTGSMAGDQSLLSSPAYVKIPNSPAAIGNSFEKYRQASSNVYANPPQALQGMSNMSFMKGWSDRRLLPV